jgi:tRNA threonylcarbamoyladenosine biosynthesis protein TsaE
MQRDHESTSVEDTRDIAARYAAESTGGAYFVLSGPLGAGKTEFIRGFIRHFDPQARVRSPSFALVYAYTVSAWSIYHFDFYRLTHEDELITIGYQEYIEQPDAITLIEWGEKFPHVVPSHARYVVIADAGAHQRRITVTDTPPW